MLQLLIVIIIIGTLMALKRLTVFVMNFEALNIIQWRYP